MTPTLPMAACAWASTLPASARTTGAITFLVTVILLRFTFIVNYPLRVAQRGFVANWYAVVLPWSGLPGGHDRIPAGIRSLGVNACLKAVVASWKLAPRVR